MDFFDIIRYHYGVATGDLSGINHKGATKFLNAVRLGMQINRLIIEYHNNIYLNELSLTGEIHWN